MNYCMMKKIYKNGVFCYLEYCLYYNFIIKEKDLEEYVEVNKEIFKSNWGIGIDIIEDGLFKKLGKLFK